MLALYITHFNLRKTVNKLCLYSENEIEHFAWHSNSWLRHGKNEIDIIQQKSKVFKQKYKLILQLISCMWEDLNLNPAWQDKSNNLTNHFSWRGFYHIKMQINWYLICTYFLIITNSCKAWKLFQKKLSPNYLYYWYLYKKQNKNKTKQNKKKTPLISHFKREPFLNNGNRKLTKYNVHTSSKASIF